MDGMDAGVMDTPDVETPELEADVEVGESGPDTGEGTEQPEAEPVESGESDNPFTTKFSREYRQFLNNLKATSPEAAKFVKQAKDDYARLYELKRIEGRGIDGIRERYAALDALSHGELKGTEALAAMQESIREAEEVDSYILNGDPKAFESMGPEFDAGLAKLAPAYLDRLAKNPEAYQAAIMPHVVSTLGQSEALRQFNYLVDIFKGEYGQLDGQTLYKKTIEALAKMGTSFNELEAKATKPPALPAADPKVSDVDERRSRLEQDEQTHYWKTNIQSQTDPYANSRFEEMFKPYQQRLKLGAEAKEDLRSAWIAGVTKAMNADQAYVRQIKQFRAQKNPDPAVVTNFVKTAINKHAKEAFTQPINRRYGNFLAGKPRTVPTQQKAAAAGAPPSPNWEARTVMPAKEDVDWTRTTRQHVWENKRILKNGKRVQGPV